MVDIKSFKDEMGIKYQYPNQDNLYIYKAGLEIIDIARDYVFVNKNLSEGTVSHFNLGFDVVNQSITIPETKNREIVNIAYRSIEKDTKEKYRKYKGCENWIFNEEGLDAAKKKGSILITSNQFDAMSAYQAGIDMVVSVPSNKDSVGIGDWVELFDNIPKIYICFENTKQGKRKALYFSERINAGGIDKCYEIALPEDSTDLNDYFKKYDVTHFRDLWKIAKPYYKYTYLGLIDVINDLRENKGEYIQSKYIPYVEFEDNSSLTAIISGFTNIGKSTFAWNVATELAMEKNIPVLILPIERGIYVNGRRFLQVMLNKTKNELRDTKDKEWDDTIELINKTPVYFAKPRIDDLEATIIRAKKLFGVRFVILDHLDLAVRNKETKDYNTELAKTIQNIIRIGQDNNVHQLVIHHIKKTDNPTGGTALVKRKPTLLDLKGSGAVKDDPEVVVMLSEPEKEQILVDILKNKGEMGEVIYNNNTRTGRIGLPLLFTPETQTDLQKQQIAFDKF